MVWLLCYKQRLLPRIRELMMFGLVDIEADDQRLTSGLMDDYLLLQEKYQFAQDALAKMADDNAKLRSHIAEIIEGSGAISLENARLRTDLKKLFNSAANPPVIQDEPKSFPMRALLASEPRLPWIR